jgi:hypothetical protein
MNRDGRQPIFSVLSVLILAGALVVGYAIYDGPGESVSGAGGAIFMLEGAVVFGAGMLLSFILSLIALIRRELPTQFLWSMCALPPILTALMFIFFFK